MGSSWALADVGGTAGSISCRSSSSASSSCSSASRSSSSISAAKPTGWPSASLICLRFSVCSVISSIVLSTSSMLVSFWSFFIAWAPERIAATVSVVALAPSSMIFWSWILSCWFAIWSAWASYIFFLFKHCKAARLFFIFVYSFAFLISSAIFFCRTASLFSSISRVSFSRSMVDSASVLPWGLTSEEEDFGAPNNFLNILLLFPLSSLPHTRKQKKKKTLSRE
mmetsp:Transcript_4543/g.10847  ORF Transcript_4543/g.10847 Transcript_4543/m.10847 type:complete len:225 (-) Transcript_4543:180-854(-)